MKTKKAGLRLDRLRIFLREILLGIKRFVGDNMDLYYQAMKDDKKWGEE